MLHSNKTFYALHHFMIKSKQTMLILSWWALWALHVPLWLLFFFMEDRAIGDLNFAFSCWNLWHRQYRSWSWLGNGLLPMATSCCRNLGDMGVNAHQVPPGTHKVFKIAFTMGPKASTLYLTQCHGLGSRPIQVRLPGTCRMTPIVDEPHG